MIIRKRLEAEVVPYGLSYNFDSWRKRLWLRVGRHIFNLHWSLGCYHNRIPEDDK